MTLVSMAQSVDLWTAVLQSFDISNVAVGVEVFCRNKDLTENLRMPCILIQ